MISKEKIIAGVTTISARNTEMADIGLVMVTVRGGPGLIGATPTKINWTSTHKAGGCMMLDSPSLVNSSYVPVLSSRRDNPFCRSRGRKVALQYTQDRPNEAERTLEIYRSII